jgi:hypothetical protein
MAPNGARRREANAMLARVQQGETVYAGSCLHGAASRRRCAGKFQRGRSERPIRKASTSRAHWRPSRIAQTTSDCPRRMSPAANTLARWSRSSPRRRWSPWRCRAHPCRRRRLRARLPHRLTKPMASSTRSAGSRTRSPGTSDILPVLPLDATALQRLDLAVLADELLGRHGEVALAAFLVRRRGAQLDRPVRPGQRLVLLLGGCGITSNWVTAGCAVTVGGADAVGAGIAAADHDDVLAGGMIGSCRRRHLLVLLGRNSIAKCTPPARGPGTGRSRGTRRRRRAPRVEVGLELLGADTWRIVDDAGGPAAADQHAGAEGRRLRPPSARRGGRCATSPS